MDYWSRGMDNFLSPKKIHKLYQKVLLYALITGSLITEAASVEYTKISSASCSAFTQSLKFASGIDCRFRAVSMVPGTITVVTTFVPFASAFISSANLKIKDFANPYATILLLLL